MKVTITSIELKGPFKFFALSAKAMGILKQLKSSECLDYKKQGIWTTHYTMSLWKNEQDLQLFARSGAHLKAMKESQSLAKRIITRTIDREQLPTWKEAKLLLKEGKCINY